MNLPRVILVPTDFGEPSAKALTYAVELAKKLGSDVVAVHTFDIPIISFPDGAMVATAEMTTRLTTAAQEGLDRTVSAYQDAGVAVRGVLRQGEPWRAILDAAHEEGAGMIVMGTHGRSGLGRLLLGSVAEKVVRTSTVPVLTVHPNDVDVKRAATAEAPTSGVTIA